MSFSSCNALQVWATGDCFREDTDVMFLLFIMLLVPRLEVVMAWFLQTVSVPSHTIHLCMHLGKVGEMNW